MFKTITKWGAAMLLMLGLTNVQAQNYLPLTILGTTGSSGNAANQFNNPSGVTIAADDKIFVADASNHRISVYTQSGNNFGNLTTFDGEVNLANQFSFPNGVAVAANGKIFVADQFNHRISVWTQSGNAFGYLTTFGTGSSGYAPNQFYYPAGVSVAADGKIYVADYSNHRISVWTQSGNAFGNLTTFGIGTAGNAPNQFNYPTGVTVAADGKVYVADYINHRISVWTQSGNAFGHLTTFGGNGSLTNQFNRPAGVTIAADGKIFVADNLNHRISVWTQSGNVFGNLTTFGSNGSADNQFKNPSGVTIAADGKIFVADRNNHRISVWSTPPKAPFITKWDLSKAGSGNTQIAFGRINTTGNVNYSWETIPNTLSGTGTFPSATNLLFTITGLPANAIIRLKVEPANFESISINGGVDKLKLVDIEQWGDVAWSNFDNAFSGCSNLNISANDVPDLTNVRSTSFMFYNCSTLNSPTNIGTWNMSNVTTTSLMFYGASSFNQPIGGWNMSAVKEMSFMFYDASKFNQSLAGWNTSNVRNTSGLFYNASKFNQPINNWDMSNVTDMSNMFYNAKDFKSDISGWNTGNVVNMSLMFANTSFNSPLNNWNTSKVTDFSSMFYFNQVFNQPLNNWVTTACTNMQSMFFFDIAFNQPIGNWNVSNVTNMSLMFYLSDFNQPIGNWNVSKVTNMSDMFAYSKFNQSISGWDISKVTNMQNLFSNNQRFDQSIESWGGKLNPNVNLNGFLQNSVGMSIPNYESSLRGFANGTVTGRKMDATSLKYCDKTFRDILTGTGVGFKSWTITGDVMQNPTAIVAQPLIQTVCGINTALLSASATGSNITYKWSNGATTSNITTTAGIYLLTVSGSCGNIISNPITVLGFKNTQIARQPASLTVCGGLLTSFEVSATGANLSYLWNNGANSSTMQTSVAGNYMVTVTGACGVAQQSNSASLTINSLTSIIGQSMLETVCGSGLTGAYVDATGNNLTYLWNDPSNYKDIDPDLPAGIFTATVSGACGTVVSKPITIVGIATTQIATQPASLTVCGGLLTSFEVSATGANLNYLWNNGANTSTMQTSTAGNYMVTVTGACGVAQQSNSASLTINSLTSIIGQSMLETVCGSGLTGAYVDATGNNLTYLWNDPSNYKDIDPDLPAGIFTATVSGACGTIVSKPITIVGFANTSIATQPASVTVCGGEFETIEVSATGTNLSYLWSNGRQTKDWFTSVAGAYMVTVSGTCGNVVSNTANFANYAPTAITSVTSNITVLPGVTTDLDVLATGEQISYAWSNGSTSTGISGVGAGTYTVTVNGFCGTLTRTVIVTEMPRASVTGFTSLSDPATGTTPMLITINGASFVNGATTSINGVALAGVTVVNGNIITATLPANVTTPYVVQVSNPNQVANVPASIPFTIALTTSTATVSGVSVNGNVSSLANGGVITINGSGFQIGIMVSINGQAMSNVTVVSGNMIVVNIPSGAVNGTTLGVTFQNPNQVAVSVANPTITDATTTSTNLPIYQSSNLAIYPNPNVGEFSIIYSLPTMNSELLTIFNSLGSLVYSQSIVSEITEVKTTLAKGIYLVKVGNAVKKLVVE